MTPYDGSIEAEYQDGYVHSETELFDVSPYEEGRNILNDVIEKRPEAEHGPLVRFTVFGYNRRYDIDWTTVPKNARPIRFKHIDRDFSPELGWLEDPRITSVDFGYQYTDENGKNSQTVQRIGKT